MKDKDSIFDSEDAGKAENMQASILEKETTLQKNKRALELVNDVYERETTCIGPSLIVLFI